MDEVGVFPQEAADVAMQAIKEGVARVHLSFDEVYNRAQKDINDARRATELLMAENLIEKPSEDMLRDALQQAIDAVK
jgi:malate dehydrogenase (oxaloacetate-decarboxylating)